MGIWSWRSVSLCFLFLAQASCDSADTEAEWMAAWVVWICGFLHFLICRHELWHKYLPFMHVACSRYVLENYRVADGTSCNHTKCQNIRFMSTRLPASCMSQQITRYFSSTLWVTSLLRTDQCSLCALISLLFFFLCSGFWMNTVLQRPTTYQNVFASLRISLRNVRTLWTSAQAFSEQMCFFLCTKSGSYVLPVWQCVNVCMLSIRMCRKSEYFQVNIFLGSECFSWALLQICMFPWSSVHRESESTKLERNISRFIKK